MRVPVGLLVTVHPTEPQEVGRDRLRASVTTGQSAGADVDPRRACGTPAARRLMPPRRSPLSQIVLWLRFFCHRSIPHREGSFQIA